MLANGFMSAQTAARCYVRRQAIVAYSVHMGQFHVPQNSFRVKQVALVAHIPNPLSKRECTKARDPIVSYIWRKARSLHQQIDDQYGRFAGLVLIRLHRNTIRKHEVQLEHSEMMASCSAWCMKMEIHSVLNQVKPRSWNAVSGKFVL